MNASSLLLTSQWRHVKSGGLYQPVLLARYECDNTPAVVYANLDKHEEPWIRPTAEFMDGRFVLHYEHRAMIDEPPLSHAQIASIIRDRVAMQIARGEPITPSDWHNYARAIERAHGIGRTGVEI